MVDFIKETEMGLVSVIVPVYNVYNYLNDCINSIIAQSYSNLEIIIVDDGSTDDSGKLCDWLSTMDSRIKVIHKPNGGLSSARNAGLEIAKGDYISFVDSDDVVPTNFISQLLEVLKETKADISVCKIDRFRDDGKKIGKPFYPFKDGLYSAEQYISYILRHKVDTASWNKLYRATKVKNYKFIEGIINEDFPFVISYLSRINKVAYTNNTHYGYRKRSGSITQIVKPNIYDFVNNAIRIKDILPDSFEKLERAYLYYETVNCSAIIIEGNSMNSLGYLRKKCNDIIKANIIDFLTNKYSSNKQKIKYFLTLFPELYLFFYKRLK